MLLLRNVFEEVDLVPFFLSHVFWESKSHCKSHYNPNLCEIERPGEVGVWIRSDLFPECDLEKAEVGKEETLQHHSFLQLVEAHDSHYSHQVEQRFEQSCRPVTHDVLILVQHSPLLLYQRKLIPIREFWQAVELAQRDQGYQPSQQQAQNFFSIMSFSLFPFVTVDACQNHKKVDSFIESKPKTVVKPLVKSLLDFR